MDSVSKTDSNEAFEIGREASLRAETGQTGIIMFFDRKWGPVYECSPSTAILEDVAGKVRLMPDEFLNVELASLGNTTEEFKNYLEPLTGAPLDIPKYLIEN